MVSIYDKFRDGTLTQQDVKRWIKRQPESKLITSEKELNHVAMCLHHIYQWYNDDLPIGHFLTAVLKNDFMEICGQADDANRKVLPLYAKFLYNIVPADYRTKAKRWFE